MPARDRSRPFWSKWVWKDWDAKTQDLDAFEYTAYHRLLNYAATNSPDLCSVPDDDVRLARAIRFGLRRWRSVRSKVLQYFVLRDDGRYENTRLREDATAFLQLVANPPRRVNGPLSKRDNGMAHPGDRSVLHARGGQKLEVRSKKEEEEESTPPVLSHRADKPPSGRIPVEGSPSLLTNTGQSWQPTQVELDAWSKAYVGLDVIGTIVEASAWLIANPTRRKTFNGMPRFVNGWLAREQNRL